ncbi:MAG: amidohydrolase [Gemmatimonadota bacterium]
MKLLLQLLLLVFCTALGTERAAAQNPELERQLTTVTADVEANRKLAQVMVDKIFSFSELGFHETETSRYIISILKQNGFRVREGISGIPTAWWAEWGSGKPVIALGSDIDAIPQASQKPGVAYRDPIVQGAPGHGEGHNSGQAVNVVAALALKRIMEREKIPGTIVLWPGVAEELVAAKAWFVRDGMFKNVDAVIFTHVDTNFSTPWGQPSGTGLVSVEFEFTGESAHGAGSPWRGRSALDAVELMNIGWNYRREHLRPEQRSHYVITDGGDQPNVVPPKASVWYYFREMDYQGIRKNFDIGVRIAEAAAKMTDTEVRHRILGTAWPRHFNRTIAEVADKHVRVVGLPQWTEQDQQLARAVQKEVASTDTSGLATRIDSLRPPSPRPASGGSDDIGDVSWVVPTITLRYPANIPGATGHHWSSAIAMATPIAPKGVTAGAKVLARTVLELLLTPAHIDDAWKYFREVQTKNTTYTPFIGPNDPPPIWLNRRIMEEYRPQLRRFYYDETKHDTYLQQLGITYPTLRK